MRGTSSLLTLWRQTSSTGSKSPLFAGPLLSSRPQSTSSAPSLAPFSPTPPLSCGNRKSMLSLLFAPPRHGRVRTFAASVLSEYRRLVQQGAIVNDESQLAVAQEFDRLLADLKKYKPLNCNDYDPFISRLDYENRQLLTASCLEYDEDGDVARGNERTYTASSAQNGDSSANSSSFISDLEDAPPFRGGDVRLKQAKSTLVPAPVSVPAPVPAPPPPPKNNLSKAGRADETLDEKAGEEVDALLQTDIPRGVYLYGTVGSGKTMLMDLFCTMLVSQPPRRAAATTPCTGLDSGAIRVHFQPFMDEVMLTLHEWRNTASLDELRQQHSHNLMRAMAKSIAEKARVICFDEVQMPDPASAVFIHSLFNYLFRYGVVLVATSNRPLNDLCMQGFRSVTATRFIGLLEAKCMPMALIGGHDYRLQSMGGYDEQAYLQPVNNQRCRAEFEQQWHQITGQAAPTPVKYVCFGREMVVDRHHEGAVRLSFQEVCSNVRGSTSASQSPLGPHDFLQLARRFHTVFLEDLPSFSLGTRNEARRFIWLIDALYEHHCNIVVLAEAPIESLFVDSGDTDGTRREDDIMLQESLGSLLENRFHLDERQTSSAQTTNSDWIDVTKSHIFTGKDDVFSFARCQSRLREMQSHAYRAQRHVKERNQLDKGRTLAMPSPPPKFEPAPQEQQDDSKQSNEVPWAATQMAPPLDLRVDDIRRKVREFGQNPAATSQPNSFTSLTEHVKAGWDRVQRMFNT